MVRWADSELTWVPSNYGGLQTLYVSQDVVWKPDLTLKNGFASLSELGSTFLHVKIDYQGNVQWTPYEVFESKCPVNIKYYPFDTQQCSLEFVSWSTGMDEVLLETGPNGVVLSDYDQSTEWDITSLTTSTENEGNAITLLFNIGIKRKPMFFIVNMILPIVLLAFLSLFTFVLPADCGEKISYSITVFLAFAVFLTIVSAALPANSQTISLISSYLVFHLIQGTFIIVLAGIQIRIISWDGAKRVPRCLVCLVKAMRYLRCRRGCCSLPPRQLTDIGDEKISHSEQNEHKDKVENIPLESSTKLNKQPEPEIVNWKDIALMLDVVFFSFFSFSLLVSTIVVMGVGAAA